MDELIEKLTSQLGIDASTAKSATGKAMAMVKEQAGDDLFSKISGMVPGLGEAAEEGAAAQEDSGGGGLMGAIGGIAGGLLGGTAGDAAKMTQGLADSGLDPGQMGGFVSTVIEFLKEKLGDDMIEQLLAKVPALKGLM